MIFLGDGVPVGWNQEAESNLSGTRLRSANSAPGTCVRGPAGSNFGIPHNMGQLMWMEICCSGFVADAELRYIFRPKANTGLLLLDITMPVPVMRTREQDTGLYHSRVSSGCLFHGHRKEKAMWCPRTHHE